MPLLVLGGPKGGSAWAQQKQDGHATASIKAEPLAQVLAAPAALTFRGGEGPSLRAAVPLVAVQQDRNACSLHFTTSFMMSTRPANHATAMTA